MNSEKYILVTGATSGIGLQSAKALLEMGYRVFGTSRSEEKEIEARKTLGSDFFFIRADLSSINGLKKVAASSKEYISGSGLYALINNAGTFYSNLTLSEDNIEMQFAVNAAAPLYLSLQLYSELKKAKGRIINVTSSSHYNTIINWKDPQLLQHYGQLRAYKQTKAFSVMLSREFNLRSESVKTYMADPGLVSTDIGFKNTSLLGRMIWAHRKSIGQTVEAGAATSVYLASEDSLPDAMYYKYCKPQLASKSASSDKNSKRIWDYFINLYGIDIDEYIKE
ncbi:MAG: SDR family NAD(P)-dependent oxidoreductase [Clostridia bacterium]|nr:SDR family NAD(P)-dependent oxidoreductase [Clostridia bacterium]